MALTAEADRQRLQRFAEERSVSRRRGRGRREQISPLSRFWEYVQSSWIASFVIAFLLAYALYAGFVYWR